MGRINLRDANEFDLYGVEGTGGLLGMLQAMIRQGQVEPRADLNPRNPGYETPTVPQMSDFGQTPPTRITVRPFDAYSPSDSEASGGEGGLLGRWLALQAEQSRDQSTPLESGQPQSAPYDPNFRQLSRAPIAVRSQGAIGPFNPPDDQSSPTYSPFGGSTALDPLRTSRQGGKAAQPDRSFSDRIQASWDHPHPYGLISMLKGALNEIEQAVQGSIDATSVPSTEEEAFRQNQGRELGPIGALKGVSLLAPATAARVGGILARQTSDGLFNGLRSLSLSRIGGQGVDRLIGNAKPSVRGLPSPNRTLSAGSQNAWGFSNEMAAPAGAGLQSVMRAAPQTRSGLFGSGVEAGPLWSAPQSLPVWWGFPGGGRLAPPLPPMTVPPIPVPRFPDWRDLWKTLQLYARDTSGTGGGGGGGGNEDGCDEERRVASEECLQASRNNWKGEYSSGVYGNPKKRPRTIDDCIKARLSERCGGGPLEYDRKKTKPYR